MSNFNAYYLGQEVDHVINMNKPIIDDKYGVKSIINGSTGFFYDLNDMTPDKLSWRRNLLSYSNDLTKYYSNQNVTSVLQGLDNTLNRNYYKIVENTSNATHNIYTPTASNISGNSSVYTLSIYLKAAERNLVIIRAEGVNAHNYYATIDLSSGVIVKTNTSTTVQDVGNGWYRCSISVTAVVEGTLRLITYIVDKLSSISIYGPYATYTGDGVSGILASSGQVERSTYPTEYEDITNINKNFKELFPNHLLYRDIYMNEPAMTIGVPIALVLDKSKKLALSSELFTSALDIRNWSTSNVASRTINSFTTNGAGSIYKQVVSTPITGKVYKIRIVGTSTAELLIVNVNVTKGNFDITILTGSDRLFLELAEAGTVTVSSISVKEILGNHAYQKTSSMRPLLGRHPASGARNILTYSGDVNNSTWYFNGNKTAGYVDSRGGYRAIRLLGPCTAVPYKKFTAPVTDAYTFTIRLKGVPLKSNTTELCIKNNTTAVNFPIGNLNLDTGVISGEGWSSKPVSNGFWECTFTIQSGINSGDDISILYASTTIPTSTFGIIIDCAQVEIGLVSTAFQVTKSLLDITEEGQPDCWYAKFDGVDDFLQTNNIDFTTTDKVSLFAGVHKSKDGSLGVIAEHGANTDEDGSFAVTTASDYGYYLQNGAISDRTLLVASGGDVAPRRDLLTVKIDRIKTDTTELKYSINGSVLASDLVQIEGTGAIGNFKNYPLYIGRRAGTSLPLNGNLYSLIGTGRLTTDSETLALEKASAKKTGVILNV